MVIISGIDKLEPLKLNETIVKAIDGEIKLPENINVDNFLKNLGKLVKEERLFIGYKSR